MKYEFHVGDYVEDVTGRIGYISSFCKCKFCKKRGFYEPHVMYSNGDCDYITVYEYKKGFPSYKRIGQYDFTKKDEGKIEPISDNYTESFPIFKTQDSVTRKTYKQECYSIDIGVISKKINELIEAVNRLEEKVNGN